MSTQTLMTADQLLALPNDGKWHELVDGELRTMTPAGGEHGVIAARILRHIGNFVDSHSLGLVFGAETGFHFRSDPDTVRAPDVAFVQHEHVPETGIPQGYWPGSPDLAVEVISPSDRYEEVEEKVLAWLTAGTELVWVVNPRTRTVTVHSRTEGSRILSENEELSGGAVVPGFSCRVAELFS